MSIKVGEIIKYRLDKDFIRFMLISLDNFKRTAHLYFSYTIIRVFIFRSIYIYIYAYILLNLIYSQFFKIVKKKKKEKLAISF